jgi:hypothetical protein
MYFVYTPARNPATLLRDMAAQHIDHDKPHSCEKRSRKAVCPPSHNCIFCVLSDPHKGSVICPSSESLYSPPGFAARGSCLSVILLQTLEIGFKKLSRFYWFPESE